MQVSPHISMDDSLQDSFRSDDINDTEMAMELPGLLSANQLLDSVCTFTL